MSRGLASHESSVARPDESLCEICTVTAVTNSAAARQTFHYSGMPYTSRYSVSVGRYAPWLGDVYRMGVAWFIPGDLKSYATRHHAALELLRGAREAGR
jgi:hypothetical protein